MVPSELYHSSQTRWLICHWPFTESRIRIRSTGVCSCQVAAVSASGGLGGRVYASRHQSKVRQSTSDRRPHESPAETRLKNAQSKRLPAVVSASEPRPLRGFWVVMATVPLLASAWFGYPLRSAAHSGFPG